MDRLLAAVHDIGINVNCPDAQHEAAWVQKVHLAIKNATSSANEYISKLHQQVEQREQSRHPGKAPNLNVGDLVLIPAANLRVSDPMKNVAVKARPKMEGPYVVIEYTQPHVTVQLHRSAGKRPNRFNMDQVRPYTLRSTSRFPVQELNPTVDWPKPLHRMTTRREATTRGAQEQGRVYRERARSRAPRTPPPAPRANELHPRAVPGANAPTPPARSPTPPSSARAPNTGPRELTDAKVGDELQVLWDNNWLNAKVIQLDKKKKRHRLLYPSDNSKRWHDLASETGVRWTTP